MTSFNFVDSFDLFLISFNYLTSFNYLHRKEIYTNGTVSQNEHILASIQVVPLIEFFAISIFARSVRFDRSETELELFAFVGKIFLLEVYTINKGRSLRMSIICKM